MPFYTVSIPEPSADDPETRKKEDEDHVMEILHKIECGNISVDSIIRLHVRNQRTTMTNRDQSS